MYFFISFLTSYVLLKPRDIYIHGNTHLLESDIVAWGEGRLTDTVYIAFLSRPTDVGAIPAARVHVVKRLGGVVCRVYIQHPAEHCDKLAPCYVGRGAERCGTRSADETALQGLCKLLSVPRALGHVRKTADTLTTPLCQQQLK